MTSKITKAITFKVAPVLALYKKSADLINKNMIDTIATVVITDICKMCLEVRPFGTCDFVETQKVR